MTTPTDDERMKALRVASEFSSWMHYDNLTTKQRENLSLRIATALAELREQKDKEIDRLKEALTYYAELCGKNRNKGKYLAIADVRVAEKALQGDST